MLSKDCHEETTFSFSEQAPRPPERRRNNRHLTILRVGALIHSRGRELCLIRNISAGGLMAHVYSPRRIGDEVAIELKSNQTVAGRVVWSEDANIGIEFDSPIDVSEMLAQQSRLDNGWRPRLPRVEVDRLATLRCGARIHAVNTRDISQGGVKVETDDPLEAGEDVVLTLEGMRPIHGVVRWCGDGLAGIAFNQLVPFHELMAWLSPGTARSGNA
jgi:Tfp pilus assembly protein PilZ